jgi:hypothetical protein
MTTLNRRQSNIENKYNTVYKEMRMRRKNIACSLFLLLSFLLVEDQCVVFTTQIYLSMATAPNSTLLVDNVNKILTTFIPAHNLPDSSQLYASIGVKSHGTITCMKTKSN